MSKGFGRLRVLDFSVSWSRFDLIQMRNIVQNFSQRIRFSTVETQITVQEISCRIN